MIQQIKTPNSVRGVQINCHNYIKCPLCYGCRNYNHEDSQCLECAKDAKNNICNTKKHRADLITKFITKESIKINGDVTFINNTIKGDM